MWTRKGTVRYALQGLHVSFTSHSRARASESTHLGPFSPSISHSPTRSHTPSSRNGGRWLRESFAPQPHPASEPTTTPRKQMTTTTTSQSTINKNVKHG